MNRTIALIALPLAAVSLLVGVLVLQDRYDDAPLPTSPSTRSTPIGRPQATLLSSPAAPVEFKPGSPSKEVSATVYESRVRTTFDNYRTAVSTGNTPLMEALRPVLLRDRATALRLARQELDRAGTPLDRDISSRIVDMLERSR